MSNIHAPPDRCRLIVIASSAVLSDVSDADFATMIADGDIASIIFCNHGLEDNPFQAAIGSKVALAQERGIAAIIANNSRVAGRVQADGLQLEPNPETIADAMEKHAPRMMIGCANVKTRHGALTLGELQPDYLMFGRPGGDIRPEPHPKNLALANWWSTMVEIPCIVMGGSELASVIEVAQSGAEFVALESAIFTSQDASELDATDIQKRIAKANQLLDEHAPPFESADP